MRPVNKDNARQRMSVFGPRFRNSYASQRFDSTGLETSLLPLNASRNNLGCYSFRVIPSPGISNGFERQRLQGASPLPNAVRGYSHATALTRHIPVVGRPNPAEEPKEDSTILGNTRDILSSYIKAARQLEKAKLRKPSRPQPTLMQQRAPPVPTNIPINCHIDDEKETTVDAVILEITNSESESSMLMPWAWREDK